MKTIKFNNYGLNDIEDLILKYDSKINSPQMVSNLKKDIRSKFFDSDTMHYDTKGDGQAHIVNINTLDNCEIIY